MAKPRDLQSQATAFKRWSARMKKRASLKKAERKHSAPLPGNVPCRVQKRKNRKQREEGIIDEASSSTPPNSLSTLEVPDTSPFLVAKEAKMQQARKKRQRINQGVEI